jgi:hypothetical protein
MQSSASSNDQVVPTGSTLPEIAIINSGKSIFKTDMNVQESEQKQADLG